MGKVVYEMYLKGEDVGDVFGDYCRQIDDLNKKIEKLNKKKLENKGLLNCVNCGKQIKSDAKFCPECGAEQTKYEIIDK